VKEGYGSSKDVYTFVLMRKQTVKEHLRKYTFSISIMVMATVSKQSKIKAASHFVGIQTISNTLRIALVRRGPDRIGLLGKPPAVQHL
jgi:hypothetical protein